MGLPLGETGGGAGGRGVEPGAPALEKLEGVGFIVGEMGEVAVCGFEEDEKEKKGTDGGGDDAELFIWGGSSPHTCGFEVFDPPSDHLCCAPGVQWHDAHIACYKTIDGGCSIE